MSQVPALTPDSRIWLVLRARLAAMLSALADNVWVNLVAVLAMTALFLGYPVPTSNEWPYLLQLQVAGDPTLLAGDWTFSTPDARHYVFNLLFGPLTRWIPLQLFAWGGRILCWVAITLGLFRIADPFLIPRWSVTLAVGLWLGLEQALVAGEWIFGTFEAKCIAYPLLLWSLAGFARGKTLCPALLLGGSFSFHPAVGLWGGLGIGGSLLIAQIFDQTTARRSWLQLLQAFGCVVLTGLPGLCPLLFAAGNDTYADLKFQCLTWMPIHLDPSSWSPRLILTCYVLLAFNAAECRGKRGNCELGFYLWFQVIAAIAFTGGLLAFAAGRYQIVMLMPFRLFPVFVLFFFCLHLCRLCARQLAETGRASLILGVVALLCLHSPLTGWSYELSRNCQFWTQPPRDYAAALNWVATETPPDCVLIAPPSWRESYTLGKRPLIANWWICPADRVAEWRERLAALTGFDASKIPAGITLDELEEGFARLNASDIETLRARFGGDYLVTSAEYPWQLVFAANGYRVYTLPPVNVSAVKQPARPLIRN